MKIARFASRSGLCVVLASSGLFCLATAQGARAREAPDTKRPVHAELGQPFTLAIGQSAEVESLRVTFMGVSRDSRCPSDVVCVWAGDAAVEISLSSGTDTAYATLHSTLKPRQASYGEWLVRFVALAPYPESVRAILSKHYRLTLTVTKEPPGSDSDAASR